MSKLEIKNYSTKLTEKQQTYQHYHFIYHKIDKYEYLTSEEILSSNQIQIIEQGKFNYCPLGKDLEIKQKKIEDHGEKKQLKIELKNKS